MKLGPMCAASTSPGDAHLRRHPPLCPERRCDIEPLHGEMAGAFRLRVGDYRVLFAQVDNTMRIFGVRHRSEAYR